MKLTALMLTAMMAGAGSAAVFAADCTSSFYCYGNTSNSITRVATRPPPIPPPSPRVAQQRRQQQLALRDNAVAAPRTVARPAPQATPRTTARANITPTPAPRTNIRPAPQVRANVQPAQTPAPQVRTNVRITPAPQPSTMPSCQVLNGLAANAESQAVSASKRGNRNTSVRLFREAANLRKQACR
ncbi:hypothetical protein [Thiothrix nivea]|uniref:Uncharacterized protein n=1 Tax=Thiothrix nivea (strain ATCC 35100 / DSM 5205 / JP2) TaxID=870187 RepID=A0A656HGH1_THINJ|nr:hypothetical protein [Thiothrix nivea]EIJ36121.1 hypothetical protein Thini_3616 [Thiothrix nivea DSM 5205]